ncbi:DsrE family protein [Thiomicrorhabdus heinhorstiae]|uniref:DsrE family protein n=1 Tax=Thiomicrorhabdus heinhorstiae TaxID=2748010 RepID=A0ABS0BTK1_9GAMM|nr:DsrE family protein [Thiomicrorhabdus heinhorstiae]MBF6057180.1 DsrE family protein [Thiomicrorhabdus heinhorstiae]
MRRFKLGAVLLLCLSSISLAGHADEPVQSNYKLKPVPEMQHPPSDRFPGDPAEHKVVYMWNHADQEYQLHILNSIQAMIKKYGDNVEISVVVIGPGIHALATHPQRHVEPLNYQRVESFAKDYKVRWIACGSTMNTIGWTDKDIRPFAEYADVGAAALMELQENGYKLVVW